MLEDILAYQPGSLLHRRFAELLVADLDDDARDFYGRMATDITAGAAATDATAPSAGAVIQTLLEALAAVAPARASRWRRLYREVAALVAACARNEARGDADGPALARLHQFLHENADLAVLPAIEALELAAFGTIAGA
jgi:hypothetical protein